MTYSEDYVTIFVCYIEISIILIFYVQNVVGEYTSIRFLLNLDNILVQSRNCSSI